MKKVNFLAALCCLLVFSCQVEQDEVIENNANLSTTVTHQFGSGGFGQDPNDDSKLEQSLAWAAYTAASVLYEDPLIQAELTFFLNPGTESLSMEMLLKPNTPTPDFRTQFMNRFQLFVDCSLGNVAGDDCPGGGNSPGDPAYPPCTGLSAGAEAQVFVDYLINENCLEFYLPRGFQFGASDDIASAAHSMNDLFITNKGFWFKDSGFHPESIGSLSANFIQTRVQTFIIGRPVRVTLNSNCGYNTIPVVDFKDFLDGPWPFGM